MKKKVTLVQLEFGNYPQITQKLSEETRVWVINFPSVLQCENLIPIELNFLLLLINTPTELLLSCAGVTNHPTLPRTVLVLAPKIPTTYTTWVPWFYSFCLKLSPSTSKSTWWLKRAQLLHPSGSQFTATLIL